MDKTLEKKLVNLISSKTKVDNCYLAPILDILFKKWFPLSKVPSLKTTTLEEPMSPTS